MNVEAVLSEIIAELKSTSGNEFFNTITLQLDKVIHADYTFIARLNREQWLSKTISLVAKGNIADNFEYSLTDTPCADVSDDSTCVYPQGICGLYPKDQLLIDMKIEGYIGAPLHSSHGEIMGLVVALYEKPIENEQLVKNLFELFSGRIAAEIERTEREHELQQLNENLEAIVDERTVELSTALENLQQTQEKMIVQERLAALGSLVAGVAHEINTPLGVAMLSSTNMIDLAQSLKKQIDDQTLSKNTLVSAIADLTSSGESLTHNLRRAADLVSNFKQVAVERSTNEDTKIEVIAWLKSQLTSVQPLMKQFGVTLNTEHDSDTHELTTTPSKLSQVLLNLIQNCTVHAFKSKHGNNLINISTREINNKLAIEIHDNGVGIPAESIDKIFDPFYTTNRSAGGTGLGLSIVHSIVTGELDGTITVESKENDGTHFTILLPLNNS